MPLNNPSTPTVTPTPLSEPTFSQESQKRDGFLGAFGTVLVVITALAVAILLTLFVFQSYEVDGPSMETTLHNGDRLIVAKLPRTWARLTHHSFIPDRGQIIIFNESGLDNFGDNSDSKVLIKRVIGLPGDHVVVKGGFLTIYNAAHPGGFQPDKTMPYGKVIVTTPGNIDLTVPAGQVFVCGDNRPDSLDSRYFGPIKASQIIGELGLRVYPFGRPHGF